MTDDFRILIDALGNATLGMLGDTVEVVRVRWDEYLGTAKVSLILRNDNWDARIAALRTCDSVREMYMDELVLDFVFEDRGEPTRDDADGSSVLAFA